MIILARMMSVDTKIVLPVLGEWVAENRDSVLACLRRRLDKRVLTESYSEQQSGSAPVSIGGTTCLKVIL